MSNPTEQETSHARELARMADAVSDLRRQLESVKKERDALYGNVLNRESCWHAAERELVTVQQSRDSWQRRAEAAEKTLKEISEQLGDLIPKLQSLL